MNASALRKYAPLLLFTTIGTIAQATPVYTVTEVSASEQIAGSSETVSFALSGPSLELTGLSVGPASPVTARSGSLGAVYLPLTGSNGFASAVGDLNGQIYTASDPLVLAGTLVAFADLTVPSGVDPSVTAAGDLFGALVGCTSPTSCGSFEIAFENTSGQLTAQFSGPQFGNYYTLASASFIAAPEPASFSLLLLTGLVYAAFRYKP